MARWWADIHRLSSATSVDLKTPSVRVRVQARRKRQRMNSGWAPSYRIVPTRRVTVGGTGGCSLLSRWGSESVSLPMPGMSRSHLPKLTDPGIRRTLAMSSKEVSLRAEIRNHRIWRSRRVRPD